MAKVDLGVALRYYKRKEVQDLIVKFAQNKEIGVRYGLGFGKRPDILVYPRDVIEVVMQGATSFHCSEETWKDPLSISKNNTKKELDELRSGWDLILDIDCPILGYSALCADLIIRFLKYCGVKDFSIKFSGNKGFHIAVPFEAFPKEVNGDETRLLFPQAPQQIAAYIKENIEEELAKNILQWENGDLSNVSRRLDIPEEKLIHNVRNKSGDLIATLNVESFLEIDTVLISSRHLFRMPYSLHEKSGLVSLPIDPDRILEFSKPMAKPEKFIAPLADFLNRDIKVPSAGRLLVSAMDFSVKTNEQRMIEELREESKRKSQEIIIENALNEQFFPPCVQKILAGLEDGKKRAVFIMANFLGKLGWEKNDTISYILKWNREKNRDPLRENYIYSQMRYYKKGDGLLPPNCDNPAYYTGLQLCNPDGLCKKIKNPVNYSIVKWKMHREIKKKEEEFQLKKQKKEERKIKLEEKKLKEAEKEREKKKEGDEKTSGEMV